MHRIFKYSLQIKDQQELELPKEAVILSVINQNNLPTIYALVNDNEGVDTEKYNFYILGTGHPARHLDSAIQFLNTIQIGPFIWHIFYNNY